MRKSLVYLNIVLRKNARMRNMGVCGNNQKGEEGIKMIDLAPIKVFLWTLLAPNSSESETLTENKLLFYSSIFHLI